MMFKLFKRLLDNDNAQVEAAKFRQQVIAIDEAFIEAIPVKDIGEPVISLAKSILETEDWSLDVDRVSVYSKVIYIKNNNNRNLTVVFTRYGMGADQTFCKATWMTEDEQSFMVGVLENFYVVLCKREQQREKVLNAHSREMFMRELVEGYCQLELQLN
jgi:hypothetical protein